MMTAHGGRYDLSCFDPQRFEIGWIAHHLAHISRFTGACKRLYSVAEHSLLVEEILEREAPDLPGLRLAGLMHDAHEAVINDVSQPMKEALRAIARVEGRPVSDWDRIEIMHARAVQARYCPDWTPEISHWVRWADLTALCAERQQLMPPGDRWEVEDTHPAPNWVSLNRCGFEARDWQQAFIDKFEELSTQALEAAR